MQRGLASLWIFPEVVEERCAGSGSGRGVETVSREEAERTARYGRTALIWAFEGGHIETARLLVDKGAGVNELIDACSRGDVERARLLVEMGADVNAKGKCAASCVFG